jgi:hypothetical protein
MIRRYIRRTTFDHLKFSERLLRGGLLNFYVNSLWTFTYINFASLWTSGKGAH